MNITFLSLNILDRKKNQLITLKNYDVYTKEVIIFKMRIDQNIDNS